MGDSLLDETFQASYTAWNENVVDLFSNLQTASKYAASTVGEDLSSLATMLNDPRNAWIGANPVGKVGIIGLGAFGGALRAIGGSREALSPFLLQAWKRGEELAEIHKAVRKSPNVYGFETASAWRHSLSERDAFSMFMYEQTTKKLSSAEVNKEKLLNLGDPTEDVLSKLAVREKFPPGESEAVRAIGLDRMKLARKRGEDK